MHATTTAIFDKITVAPLDCGSSGRNVYVTAANFNLLLGPTEARYLAAQLLSIAYEIDARKRTAEDWARNYEGTQIADAEPVDPNYEGGAA